MSSSEQSRLPDENEGSVVEGTMVVLGGEADNRVVHGHAYGHLSEMVVLGTLSVIE